MIVYIRKIGTEWGNKNKTDWKDLKTYYVLKDSSQIHWISGQTS